MHEKKWNRNQSVILCIGLKKIHHMNLPENVRMKMALECLEPHICLAISSHGPKTLDEVRVLAGRVETIPPPPVATATADPSQKIRWHKLWQ